MIKVKTLEQIIIEACKSRTTEKELRNIYDECYLTDGDTDAYHKHMAVILGRICTKYLTPDVVAFATEMGPDNDWKYKDNTSYWYRVVLIFTSTIRLTDVTMFGDMFTDE